MHGIIESMLRSRLLLPGVLVAGCLVTLGATGRPAGAPTDAISVSELERRLRFIASDALDGRESLSPGFRAAAAYLASELADLGLTPRGDDGSFLQRVTMRRTSVDPAVTVVDVAGQRFTYGDDLLASGGGSAKGRVVYVGHGYRIPSKQIDPFAGVDVKDALLLVLPGTPSGVTFRDLHERAGSNDAGPSFALGTSKQVQMAIGGRVTYEDTFNVVASVEGTDPMLRSEFIALGAHLDHIGRLRPASGGASARERRDESVATAARDADVINNGADDDGSGVVALVEMAAAASRGPRPRRSLLFVWHTGEESGGWGARYVTAFPPVPIDQIVAQLNLDMIGRSRRPGDQTAANYWLTGPDEVYLVGASRLSHALGDTVASVNRAYLNLTLNPKYDDPADPERIYERSDHYEYAQKRVPVAFFFSGLHEDYHRPSDEVDRIDFVKLQKIARTVLAVAWALGNAPDRPALDLPPAATGG